MDVALNIARAETFAVAVNTGGRLIRVLNERNVGDGGSLCFLCLEILKSVGYSVGNTS